VLCALCGIRKARRTCPAIEKQICTVCCGTKRLTQINCPSDCPYLATSRHHPPAATVRAQERDVERIVQLLRDLNQRQSELFFLVGTFLAAYQSPELQALIDDDVAEATGALASTYETASRGVIYEHRPASVPAERLLSGLKPLLAKAGTGGGSAFDRDAGVVLRRIEAGSRDMRGREPDNRGAFLDLLTRLIRTAPASHEMSGPPEANRLIVL
jgi:hypothetical protein